MVSTRTWLTSASSISFDRSLMEEHKGRRRAEAADDVSSAALRVSTYSYRMLTCQDQPSQNHSGVRLPIGFLSVAAVVFASSCITIKVSILPKHICRQLQLV